MEQCRTAWKEILHLADQIVLVAAPLELHDLADQSCNQFAIHVFYPLHQLERRRRLVGWNDHVLGQSDSPREKHAGKSR
jgi:hypothetical protein